MRAERVADQGVEHEIDMRRAPAALAPCAFDHDTAADEIAREHADRRRRHAAQGRDFGARGGMFAAKIAHDGGLGIPEALKGGAAVC